MFNLIPLIQNENMKIYRRVVSWVMIGLVVLINLIVAIFNFSLDNSSIQGMSDYVLLSSQISSFIVLFTIVIAGGIVSTEFSWGTIKLLLIRPVSRTKILLAKYIATLIFSVVLLIIILITAILFGLLFWGVGSSDATIANIAKDYAVGAVDMLMTVTFAFMISTVFRSNALAITLSYIIYFFSGTIIGILSTLKYNWGKYILFANTNFTQYSDGYEPLFAGMTPSFSAAVVIVYFVLFLLISWYVFKKRDISF